MQSAFFPALLLFSLARPIAPAPFPRELQTVTARITAQSLIREKGRNTPVAPGTGNLTGYVCPTVILPVTTTAYVTVPYAPIALTCERGYYHSGGSAHAWRVSVRCSPTYDAISFMYDFTASTPCVTTAAPAADGLDPGCGVGATVGRPCFCQNTGWSFDYFAGTATCLAWCV